METDKLTNKIIKCTFEAHNTLGSGFLGKENTKNTKNLVNHVNPVKK